MHLEHHRIQDLAVYWNTGWPTALPAAKLRETAATQLATAAGLLPAGFGLAVFDAFRPLTLQQALFDAAYTDPGLPPGFVTPPSQDLATPPPHATGGAVDVTLTWQQRPLALGTAFDAFTPIARTAALERTPRHGSDRAAHELRRLLYWSMRAAGFVVLDCEWWHYELGTPRWAALTGTMPWYSTADGPVA